MSVELVATGSEVWLARAVAAALRADGYGVRVVSPLDRKRYRRDPSATVISIDAGVSEVCRGSVDFAIGIDEFGHSGPGDDVPAHHGFTPEALLARIREFLASRA